MDIEQICDKQINTFKRIGGDKEMLNFSDNLAIQEKFNQKYNLLRCYEEKPDSWPENTFELDELKVIEFIKKCQQEIINFYKK